MRPYAKHISQVLIVVLQLVMGCNSYNNEIVNSLKEAIKKSYPSARVIAITNIQQSFIKRSNIYNLVDSALQVKQNLLEEKVGVNNDRSREIVQKIAFIAHKYGSNSEPTIIARQEGFNIAAESSRLLDTVISIHKMRSGLQNELETVEKDALNNEHHYVQGCTAYIDVNGKRHTISKRFSFWRGFQNFELADSSQLIKAILWSQTNDNIRD
jgi:hypothetical protein